MKRTSVKLLLSLLFAAPGMVHAQGFSQPASPMFPAQPQPVTVTIASGTGADIPPLFLGLSYESSMELPDNGHYYFDANNKALVNMFKTIGIKDLRVGANAVDDKRVPVPQEPDIDSLFAFARAADAKVIYSFRLKNGDPADSARLATYIAGHYADTLDCYSVGNEPNFSIKAYPKFIEMWKPHYDAILQAVPKAMFCGPSADRPFARNFAHDMAPGGHIAMVSDHYYFIGSGREGEKDPPATRAKFLSDDLHAHYEKVYGELGAQLATDNVPYRIDELNSCYNGGAKDSSDTYASALWVLDCTHWWAAHHMLGMNYHTGELVGRDGKFAAPNYAAFLKQEGGFDAHPLAYGFLAFSQGARGQSLPATVQAAAGFDFDAYAYRDHDSSLYVTLINKSYGDKAQAAQVSLQLPTGVGAGTWQRLDLEQKSQDVAAKTDVTVGGAPIDAQGTWKGQWKAVNAAPGNFLKVPVGPASATILRLSPAK